MPAQPPVLLSVTDQHRITAPTLFQAAVDYRVEAHAFGTDENLGRFQNLADIMKTRHTVDPLARQPDGRSEITQRAISRIWIPNHTASEKVYLGANHLNLG